MQVRLITLVALLVFASACAATNDAPRSDAQQAQASLPDGGPPASHARSAPEPIVDPMAPAEPGPPLAAAPTSQAACYWQSPIDNSWKPLENWSDYGCFAADACLGGLGQYAGGCYKWATDPDAPPLPWPADATLEAEKKAALQRATPPQDQIPLEYGLFVTRYPCEGEACNQPLWRAKERVPVYAEPDQFSREIGRTRINEVISRLGAIRYRPARRAVMTVSLDKAEAGDIVFIIGNFCKGMTAWRRGAEIYVESDQVAMDPAPRLHRSRAGHWTQIRRANGEQGWIRTDLIVSYFTDLNPPPPRDPQAEDDEMDACE